MEFRLVYDGVLKGASKNDPRSQHKHEIRKVFHSQLKRLWEKSPYLGASTQFTPYTGVWGGAENVGRTINKLASRFRLDKFSLVPLVTADASIGCSLDIMLLRYDQPGQALLLSGDIDNRLKTLFDALRMPKVGEYCGEPSTDEEPFFCLLEDDSLITGLTVTTDVLLEPNRDINDVRLIIKVRLWPTGVTFLNIGFGW